MMGTINRRVDYNPLRAECDKCKKLTIKCDCEKCLSITFKRAYKKNGITDNRR